MDAGHRETDKRLAELEKRIRREYRQAEKEVEEKLNRYMERFAEKDKAKRKQLRAGEITRQQYNEWRTGQIMMGQRWSEMRETLASDMVRTNEIARSMVREFSYDAYALNHNYGTFEVEKGSRLDTSYTLYDRHTVERLMRDNPDMLPPPGKRVMENIRLGKDKLWNKQQIQSVMMQSILQGESMPQIAKRLTNAVGNTYTIEDIKDRNKKTAKQIAKELARKNKAAAIRNARTMTTRAENYGRLDSYKRAQGMGIPVKKQWVATLDNVTRDSHVDVDGEIVDIDATFSNGLDCPGGMGPPDEVYNCRCALIAAIKGFEKDLSDTNLRRNEKLGSMSYDEWKESRKKPGAKTPAMKPQSQAAQSQPVKPDSDSFKLANEYARVSKVDYNEVEYLDRTLTEQEIIDKIGGGDLTEGSCASLSYAYIANKCGYDVTDYRGGDSRRIFSSRDYSNVINRMVNPDAVYGTVKKEVSGIEKVLNGLELDKEYRLGCGKHAAIVKRTAEGLQYLELQTEGNNGWKPFEYEKTVKKSFWTGSEVRRVETVVKHTTSDTLYDRFKCRKTVGGSYTLIPVDDFKGNDEFRRMMGYINTDPTKQKKGAKGYAK